MLGIPFNATWWSIEVYALSHLLLQMEPIRVKLERELDGCSRVVSGTFPIPGWTPHAVKARQIDSTPLPVYLYHMDRIHGVPESSTAKPKCSRS